MKISNYDNNILKKLKKIAKKQEKDCHQEILTKIKQKKINNLDQITEKFEQLKSIPKESLTDKDAYMLKTHIWEKLSEESIIHFLTYFLENFF